MPLQEAQQPITLAPGWCSGTKHSWWPPSPYHAGVVDFWSIADSRHLSGTGTAMTPVLLALLFTKIKTDSPFFVRPITSAISNTVFSSFITPEVR